MNGPRLEKKIRIRIDNRTRLRYVVIPESSELWIHVSQRKRWRRRKSYLYKCYRGDHNIVLYEYVQTRVPDLLWNVIERALKMSNEGRAA